VVAISVALHSLRVADEDETPRDWTAWLLTQPLGAALVFAIGIGFVVAGIGFAIKGIRAEFRQRLFAAARARKWIVRLGQYGVVARGVVFALIGVFLMTAALRFNSERPLGSPARCALCSTSPMAGSCSVSWLSACFLSACSRWCRRCSGALTAQRPACGRGR
jgi:hypothetical protein